MRQRAYSSEGIVLARRAHGEADRILILYTKHFGKLKMLAKGVRKPKSRKRGHVEIFTRLKFSATDTKGLPIMTEAEIIDGFLQTRGDLKKVTLAYYFMEVIGRVTHEEEANGELYELIINYLKKLGLTTKLKTLRQDFVRDVLITLGFWNSNKKIGDVDRLLEEIVERKINSKKVGSLMLQ